MADALEETATASEGVAIDRLCRVWAAGLLILASVTWPLWTPLRTAPRLPAFGWLTNVPVSIDFPLLALLAVGAAALLFRPDRRRFVAVASACLAALMAFDQLRWQPWAYQLLLMGVAITFLPPRVASVWLRWLMISIYLFAAEAKLDAVFLNTTGQQLLGALTSLVGVDANDFPDGLRTALAAVMPLSEAAIGIALCFHRTHRAAVIAAGLLHGAVIFALGPLGLGHQLGVLVWNGVFACLVGLLFWPNATRPADDNERPPTPRSVGSMFAIAVLLIAIAAPLTRPMGWWDRWPSWGLYAPRGELAEVFVHDNAADRLPDELPIDEVAKGDRWRRVRIDDWVLKTTGAPRYPQNRVAVALAISLDDRARLGSYLKVTLQSPASRLSGDRTAETLVGAKAVRDYAGGRYWLNTRPRWSR